MSPAGGRYRRVRSRLFLEPAFHALTEGEKLASIYLLGGPQTNAAGVYCLSPGAASEHLCVTVATFRRRLTNVLRVFRWRFDAAADVIWIPEWLSENVPHNPNAVKALRVAFDEVPDCDLKREAGVSILTFLVEKGEPFAKPFREPLREPLPEPFGVRSGNDPDPDPDPGMVRRTNPQREAVRRAHRASTNETVERLRVISEHHDQRSRSGS